MFRMPSDATQSQNKLRKRKRKKRARKNESKFSFTVRLWRRDPARKVDQIWTAVNPAGHITLYFWRLGRVPSQALASLHLAALSIPRNASYAKQRRSEHAIFVRRTSTVPDHLDGGAAHRSSADKPVLRTCLLASNFYAAYIPNNLSALITERNDDGACLPVVNKEDACKPETRSSSP